jgi:hypothetical protein
MPDSLTSEPESAFICDCDEWMRPACAGEFFYGEHEGKRYCVLHFPSEKKSADFDKALQRKLQNKDFSFSGVWFPDEVRFSGFVFSAKADFTGATFNADADFNSATFKKAADFSETTFIANAVFGFAIFKAAADFSSANFKAALDFHSANFKVDALFGSANFSEDVYFSKATFSDKSYFHSATFRVDADFSSAIFKADATFYSATFKAEARIARRARARITAASAAAADFSKATFSAAADFSKATFSAAADFSNATFSAAADFSNATFADHVRFAGIENPAAFMPTSSLNLQFAEIDKPDHVSFYMLTLHPHWFVNVDARKFDFISVDWSNSGKAKQEVELLKREGVPSPNRLLAISCRTLADNAEENDRYREASDFRRMAMDAERLETWGGWGFLKLSWWYWLASGYGERSFQALMVLIGIFLLCGALYTRVGFARWEPKLASEADLVAAKRDDVGAPLKFSRALTYSAGVMTLQKPEPRPATTAAQTVVLFETILGPVQAALLALAIRRKFMR